MDEFVELVVKAQEQGIYTIVCDGYHDGPAKQVADASFDIDVRNTDEIAAVCAEQGVDGIIASYSDLLAECLVDIADKAGLDCYAKPDRFRYLREKTLMKQMFAELGIQTAKCAAVHRDSIEEDLAQIGFPCVVKPANGYGSHGIYVLSSADEVRERFDEIASHSTFDYVLAERLYRGFEMNMMNWVVDGEVVPISIADREKSVFEPWDIPHVSRIVYPSCLLDTVLNEARAIVKKVADFVGIQNGPLSMQFFYSPEDGLKVCEIAGRLFGYEHELVTYACGLSIEELLIHQVYDKDALKRALEGHTPAMPQCSCGIYFHGLEGVVADVDTVWEAAKLPNVADVTLYYKPGEMIRRSTGSKPYVVRFYLQAATRAELDATTKRIYDMVRVLDAEGQDLLFPSQMTRY